ncbi:MAG TPA: penicillin-binding protein 2 [Thermoanaerobaculia bacterium]|nr:penicillin-binding protein 2 [Thermoanaerobaculia bacterium]
MVTMEVQRQFREELTLRVRLLFVLVAVGLIVIGGGLWYLQLVRGSHYAELAENNRVRRLTIRAPRGLILDHEGRPLVENTPSYNLMIDRSRAEDVVTSLAFAARVLERPPAELAANLAKSRQQPDYQPVPLARNLTLSEVARFSALALERPEFEIDVGHLRLYRHGPQMAHVIGYLGEVTEADMERARSGEASYLLGDLIGKKGVEQTYDGALRGANGERAVVVDSRGKLIREYGRREADPGEPLRLTLDLDLQQAAERAMRGQVGAVVALDPRNGAVRAMVSTPSYDPNLFARGIGPDAWRELIENDLDPLQNRAIQNAHPPGSVFKIFMAAAGLQEGVITPASRVSCGGGTVIYGRRFKCWRPGGHGSVDLRKALAQSCNVYFYHLGRELGIDRIAKYSKMFGLGSPTGIELANEVAGLVPSPEWSQEVRGHQWFPGETISVAIGQGLVNTTPIQIAAGTAAIANGGRLVVPHLVEGSVDPAELERVPIDPEHLQVVREGMHGVMSPGGTAWYRAHIEGIEYAGKTGTAQVVGGLTSDNEDRPWRFRNHGWFTSFAPFENPELVVVVFVEHGGGGSAAASPVAKEVYMEYFEILERRKAEERAAAQVAQAPPAPAEAEAGGPHT